MSCYNSVETQDLFEISPDFQFNPTSTFMEGQLFVDNSCFHGNPSLSSPGEHFDILKSAALFAGIIQDQSFYPDDYDGQGLKSARTEASLFGDVGLCRYGPALAYQSYHFAGDDGFDGDTEDDVSVCDDYNDEFFSPRPADTCTEFDEANDSCREPPAKRRRLFSPEPDTKPLTLKSDSKRPHVKQDKECFSFSPANKHNLLGEDLYISDSEDDSGSDEADSSIETSGGSSSGESSDSDTTDSDSSFDESYDVSDEDTDISTYSESEHDSFDASYEKFEHSDDDSDDYKCDVTCVCQSGSYFSLKHIERKLRVSVPLYTKLLKHRMMKTSHRFSFECCDSLCSFRWRVKRREHVFQDYAKSDLRVEYFKWGKWKVEDLEEGEDDSDSVSDDNCKTMYCRAS